MSYYPTPGAPYVPQQPVNPYGGMGTVGLATPLPNAQMQQAQPQRPQPMNGQQPVQQSAQYHLRPERFLGCYEHDVLGLLSGRKAPVR